MTDHYEKEESFKEEMRKKLDPMYELFTETKGWGNITLIILKGVILIAAAIAALYGVLRWIKE